MYSEYKAPKVRFVIDINEILFVLGIIIVVGSALFGIVVGMLCANTEKVGDRLENDCLTITYKENYAFKPDEDLSGVYCKEQS